MSQQMIQVSDLRRSFGATVAVDGVGFEVAAGEVVGLLGPNGAGKTTTIHCLTTLLRPDSGTARVAGFDVVRQAAEVRRSIAVTGQFAALDEMLTGRENLVLFGRLLGLGRRAAAARADELIERFDLGEVAGAAVRTYSGGLRRRVDLAASLVVDRPVLFLDEPTTGLDPRSRRALWEVVRQLRDDGTAVLLTTQYLEEADQLAARVLLVDHGRVVAEGTPDDLKGRLGGAVCEVRIEDPRDRAAASAQLRAAFPDLTEDEDVLRLAAGSGTLTEVVRRLESAGVEADDVTVRRPTLDEVFLSLTGAGVPDPAGARR
ncbi:ATP-binding cassette domain-containing protein [Micromonospora globbae]|jgi:daunorubicin resistance ABC transporter ATP-binding subunit|uniref:ATP-binding cassette domain-containing protein n=1 Tax=Micromonospora globbae TaxID=1894969 RepID=A0A420EVW4_9ACTN|nr:ATP-binding cassette domain-containing protein [Micromonospora globbae]RKF24839.1 ATP-binding cassette domain-containing protein [Micromonospora globbae]WTF83678.1 ATP-binding cassette domain-containing protein [Micromonospora globbae]